MRFILPILILGLLGLVSVAGAEEPTDPVPEEAPAVDPKVTAIARGDAVFQQTCVTCHQANGEGIPYAFPPLAGSDFLFADIDGAIKGVLVGRNGAITVNGIPYNGVMPMQNLDDDDTAAVVTYVLNSWGNEGPLITPETVAEIRAAQ